MGQCVFDTGCTSCIGVTSNDPNAAWDLNDLGSLVPRPLPPTILLMIRFAARLLVRIVLPFVCVFVSCLYFLFSVRIVLGGIDLREEQFQLTQWKIKFL